MHCRLSSGSLRAYISSLTQQATCPSYVGGLDGADERKSASRRIAVPPGPIAPYENKQQSP
jgi:hypothetical protein